ncbi:hypothetical protein [Leptospira borgpetersenii]|uniref:hypothetical protein n=1 Tax=Leptospira borgpetersenii TaxID=174 RepID=UPI000B30DFF6|nr:hypothetical protein [Leptospira borgpetersenii]
MRALITKQENQQKELRAFSFSRLFSELTNFASLVLDRVQKRGRYYITNLECSLRKQKRELNYISKTNCFSKKSPLDVGVPTSEGLGQVFSYNLSENAIYRATIEAMH